MIDNNIRREQIQKAYNYVRSEMVPNPVFTNSMVADTLRNIDQAYYKLLRCERCTKNIQTNLPSIYDNEGKLDITARRNAVIARMKTDNVGQEIWNYRMKIN